ncbi:MAG: protein adenylyltransferase SelO family protein [Planctomycetota bacterium]
MHRFATQELAHRTAKHHLGVPTTRALSLVLTGESVTRDMFYDGNPKREPGAVVCRVAPSFVRLGSFQIFHHRQDYDTLKQLADYTIRRDFPELGEPSRDVYAEWFREVCRRTATLMVHWMRVGFVHGVMNTDNLSILGQTIDYGPYGWLEDFDPNWTPNTTDSQGRRYRFGHQPQIAQWNLAQFGSALLPLVDDEVESLQEGLRAYVKAFESGWHDMLAAKLGLDEFTGEDDASLFEDLLEVLQLAETDMTIFFRRLADVPLASTGDAVCGHLSDAYYEPDALSDEVRDQTAKWFERYRIRVQGSGVTDPDRKRKMDSVNPLYVLRNYLAQLAIDRSEQGDHGGIEELLDVLRQPYTVQPGRESYAEKRPEWARHRAGCSMLSCSS